MKKTIIIPALLLYFSIFSIAQVATFYTTDKELSSSLINAIYQDKRNYIWIATEDGLNKYDGMRFTAYKKQPNDSTSIKNNYVRTLFEDSKGRFWIGCINGLLLYDRATDTFREIRLYNDSTRIERHITSIIESKDGEIWITTSGDGIIRIKDTKASYSIDGQLSSRLSSLRLSTVFQDSKQNMWIASESDGLNLYNPETDQITLFKAPQSIGCNQISAICEDNTESIFVGTLTNGLYKYNIHSGKFDLVPHANRSVLFIKSLFIDDKGRLLVGTDGQGVKIYNKEKNCLEDYPVLSSPFDFSRMKVHAICQDRAGNLWMGLFQKGVFLDYKNKNPFNYWGQKSYSRDIIGSNCIMSLIKDKNNELWIGTDNDGIYKLDKQGNSHHFASSNRSKSVPNTILSMVEDNRGNIWLGSYLSGLVRFDKRTGHCEYFNNKIDIFDYDNTARNKVFALFLDPQELLWIGTNGAGVYVFDVNKEKMVNHYSWGNTGTKHLPDDWINCIFRDSKGLIWIGSYDGIISIDPVTEQKQHYTVADNIVPGNIIYCINEDTAGNLWVGTTEGLACFNRETLKSEVYSTANGLPSNVICGILEDEQGNIWLSTHSGISKFTIRDKKFINYYSFGGLQGNEFSMGAAYKSKDGEMFFGGTSGISSFYPSKITDWKTPLNLYLTGLYILDKAVVSGQKSGKYEIIRGFISDADTIRLSYKDKMFALEFSTFDFELSGRIYYQYMLEGFSSQWMSTEAGVNRINFTNIKHGTYKLLVKASTYNNSSEEKVITLIIFPPWYLTWWAKLLYFLVFALLVFSIVRFITDRIRHKNELMRREHAEQISEAKLQFFINVSHEIRTPMALIISPLEKLISNNKNPDTQKVYLLMYRNAKRILRLINQLMDVRKLDKGLMAMKFRETDIVGFIDDLMQTFEYQAKQRNINFTFIHTDERLNVWIDLNNFDKVLVNIFSNAFKFSPENGEINVTLRTGRGEEEQGILHEYFEITVSDTGPGIEEDKIEKIFERFYQINNDTPELNFGTGVGLHLARSLVNLQHGTLYARNRSDQQGSEFIIRLPLGNAHLNDSEKESVNNSPIQITRTKLPVESFENTNETTKPKVKPKTNYRILIVEDEDEIRQYLRNELAESYRISECVNGKEALDFVLREKPNLVISDVMMPEMDGITLSKKIKSNINVNHIPVILLTAKATDEDKAEGFDAGADVYVAKPFNIDLLKKIIANILENRERLEPKAVDTEENKALIKPIVLRSSDQILYEKVIKIINDNISDPDLNVELLASGVGLSRVHMHRKLKELTNQSARDFIKSIRLKQAAELLSNQKLTVSEVAYALGFSNLSHFSTSFREFYGMSPTEYTQGYRKEEQHKV